MLLFYAGENRFSIDCSSILRIVPHVNLSHMPYEVPYLAGILMLAGKAIPVIDFCLMIEQRIAKPCLNTRIILLSDPRPGSDRIAGILGETVEQILDLQPHAFSKTEFYLHHFPFLDKGYSDSQGVIQLVNPEEFFRFLSDDLFHDSQKEPHGSG